jgi:hypothetical protein
MAGELRWSQENVRSTSSWRSGRWLKWYSSEFFLAGLGRLGEMGVSSMTLGVFSVSAMMGLLSCTKCLSGESWENQSRAGTEGRLAEQAETSGVGIDSSLYLGRSPKARKAVSRWAMMHVQLQAPGWRGNR